MALESGVFTITNVAHLNRACLPSGDHGEGVIGRIPYGKDVPHAEQVCSSLIMSNENNGSCNCPCDSGILSSPPQIATSSRIPNFIISYRPKHALGHRDQPLGRPTTAGGTSTQTRLIKMSIGIQFFECLTHVFTVVINLQNSYSRSRCWSSCTYTS